jgi:hypothetical protein
MYSFLSYGGSVDVPVGLDERRQWEQQKQSQSGRGEAPRPACPRLSSGLEDRRGRAPRSRDSPRHDAARGMSGRLEMRSRAAPETNSAWLGYEGARDHTVIGNTAPVSAHLSGKRAWVYSTIQQSGSVNTSQTIGTRVESERRTDRNRSLRWSCFRCRWFRGYVPPPLHSPPPQMAIAGRRAGCTDTRRRT